jgi:ABC-type uncharacterized transport system substrate-binding protein
MSGPSDNRLRCLAWSVLEAVLSLERGLGNEPGDGSLVQLAPPNDVGVTASASRRSAAQHRLPATYVVSEFVEAGGLMSYSPTNTAAFRAAARYVHKILQGARAADLPVEQPSKIDLSINLGAAKAIGLSIPYGAFGGPSRLTPSARPV